MKKVILTTTIMSLGLIGFSQEFKMPAPSPMTIVQQDFSTSSIELQYSRPSLKGRAMFGHLIPYNSLWRTGANQIPTITFHEAFIWGETTVAPGSYALATIPNKNEWTFILYKNPNSWGVNDLKDEDMVAKSVAKVHKRSTSQETFEIKFDDITNNSFDLVMAWEHTEARMTVKVDNFESILKHLELSLKSEDPQYLALARFYYDNDYQLEAALKYIDKGIEQNPDAFWMQWTKAQILYKLGKRDLAIQAATIAAEKTKGTPYENEYTQHLKSLK